MTAIAAGTTTTTTADTTITTTASAADTTACTTVTTTASAASITVTTTTVTGSAADTTTSRKDDRVGAKPITVEILGDDENFARDLRYLFRYYPSPGDDDMSLSGEEMKRLRVLLGQYRILESQMTITAFCPFPKEWDSDDYGGTWSQDSDAKAQAAFVGWYNEQLASPETAQLLLRYRAHSGCESRVALARLPGDKAECTLA